LPQFDGFVMRVCVTGAVFIDPLQWRLGWATQFHREARLVDRADVRHRGQGKLAAGGEQAAVLLAVGQIDDLANKTTEACRGQVERVPGARDKLEGTVHVGRPSHSRSTQPRR